jgi:tetratricopeptide (TPR) repeat protein
MKGIILILTSALLLVSCSSQNKNKTSSKKASLYYAHGTEKLIAKEYTEALKNLMTAYKLDPKDSRILNNLAMAYYFKGRSDKAIELLHDSLDLNTNNSDARNNLASIYVNQGELHKAESEYKKILENLLYKNNFRVYYNLGIIKKRQGQLKPAISYFEKASGIRIDYCASNYQLAITYRQIGNYNKSLKWFKSATREKCGENAQVYYEWAKTLNDLGQDKRAVAVYRELVDKFPKSKFSFKAERKIKLLTNQRNLSNNQFDKIESFNSQDF